MRTFREILNAAKSNQPTTHEECLYALLVCDSLSGFDRMDFMKLYERGDGDPVAKMVVEESYRRSHEALKQSPKDWLGWENDPRNPAFQQLRRAALALFEKAAGTDKSGTG